MPAWLRNVLVTILVAAVTVYATLWVADHAPPNMIWLAFLPPVLVLLNHHKVARRLPPHPALLQHTAAGKAWLSVIGRYPGPKLGM